MIYEVVYSSMSRYYLTHYQTAIFRLFQTEFADDNVKFDENGRKLSKRVENTVGKGEIARDEQFLLFPQCFQKACFPGASKGVIVWEWVNPLPCSTVKPVLQITCSKHSTAIRDHCSDTTSLLTST